MKFAFVLLLLLAVASASDKQASTPNPPAGINGFEYIRDAKKFESEDSKTISAEARRALKFARGIVAMRLDAEIDGRFSIAESSWGYQVNFTALKKKKAGEWVDLDEGFGEVFLSKHLDRVQINLGP